MVMDADGHIWQRIEELLVASDYRVFLLTGQPGIADTRQAYVAVRPFHSLEPDAVERMIKIAITANPEHNLIDITHSPGEAALTIEDKATGTFSSFPIAALDDQVRTRFGSSAEATGVSYSEAWTKYDPIGAVTVATAFAVNRPLQLRKQHRKKLALEL